MPNYEWYVAALLGNNSRNSYIAETGESFLWCQIDKEKSLLRSIQNENRELALKNDELYADIEGIKYVMGEVKKLLGEADYSC